MLVEAGELLAATMPIEARGEAARGQVEPSVQRLQQLRSQIQHTYLPQWNEQTQIQQEFARQGLDLVALDLTIALEHLTPAEPLPDSLLALAQEVIDQLDHIGQDLQLSSGWGSLLGQAKTLLTESDAGFWCSQWPRLFEALKSCARQAGEPVPFELSRSLGGNAASPAAAVDQATNPPADSQAALSSLEDTSPDGVLPDVGNFLDGLGDLGDLSDLDDPLATTDWITAAPDDGATPEPAVSPQQIQIPVPLERLDQSAQALITTLLSVRSSQALYEVLHNQILQLVSLSQEGVQHITRLRQIQDDYALMDNLKFNLRETGPTPERYRQGYTTINRLLETSLRLSELGAEAEKSARQMSDSLQFLDGSVLKLQATVEESRLVPFHNLAFRARAVLRDLTTRYHKPAKLVIHGEHTELDVGSARSLEPALLHLIRNAFDHALESPEERQTLGKPDQGTLTLVLKRQGNTYRLHVRDDGGGIDPEAICDRAQALGLPLSDTTTPANLLAVICQPGFSSETEVSDLSGRGVGMDVVANQVAKLGGTLRLTSVPGQGTTFHLAFPVPHLLESCVLFQAGDRAFAVPTDEVKTLALLETLQVSLVQDLNSIYSWQVETGDAVIPGLDLLEYWQPRLTDRTLSDSTVCAHIHPATEAQGIWLFADELMGQVDLLITPLPAPLQAPVGLMGVSLQPDGTLVPVLSATAMVEWLHQAPAESIAELSGRSDLAPQETITATATILIVDDAALMRRRLEASLTAYGHPTHTCSDGLDALNWLQTHPTPALVITDIEMPNMDGFTLIDRCRQAGMTVPILVVSSRLSEEWFDEAKRLGANGYLTKGFSTLELMTKVNQLLPSPVPSAVN
jgi:chemotaxis protein histidine kinase CheA